MERQVNWDYEVDLTDLRTSDSFGNLIENQRAAVEKKTGEVLGLVSSRYQLIQNRELHDTMQEISEESGLALEKVDVCKNGGITIFRYGLDSKHNRIVPTKDIPEDKVRFGVELINSFDRKLGPSRFRAFAERLVCTNGMTMPRSVAQFTLKSLGDLNPNTIQSKLAGRIGPICETASIWNQWAQVTPSRVRVGEFISEHFGKKAAKALLENYDSEIQPTLWGLYNLVTAYISHQALAKNPDDTRVKQYHLERIANKFYTESFV